MEKDKETPRAQDKSDTAKREGEILAFWDKEQIFEKSLQKKAPKGEYVFYDGPPFATGLPHYGHIVASVLKDAIPRFWTMRGYHVPRVWGWDCHGLPIENIVEKELGFKHKKEIIEMGVAKFNERCREQVLTYAHEWEKIIPRIGRWADMKNAYRTMDKPFMESVWWVFKQLYDKGLVYEDYRSMHVCPRCETTLSQQEVSEGYKDVKDIAVTVKFKVKTKKSYFLEGDNLLAWTTTPWTLPGNVGLAVSKKEEYSIYQSKKTNERIVVAKKLAEKVLGENLDEYKHYTNLSGSELVGLEYEPPFDYYINDKDLKNRENGWKVYHADFVTVDAGTGIAHEAPAFGADDWELLKKVNLPFVQHVNSDGTMKGEVKDFVGLEVKPRSDDDSVRLGTDIAVLKYLQEKGLLFSKENITHSYPHCWRCDTPLLNYATSSWFVKIESQKEAILKNAKPINWSPEHIKEGRWGKWLQGARDWSISRQRFWASVMPLWKCADCKALRVFGSASELEEASGQKVNDLHKHIVDEITVPCSCNGVMRRIPDVLDTWFDSGSMPYGERHYPFENKEQFEKVFPAQFIAEGLDQTRAWFYYMHVLAVSIFDRNAFQNVIVNGIVLAEDGKKMSKKLKNYPDPMDIVERYGADALRYYLMASPVVGAENLSFSERGVDEVAKKHLSRLDNVLAFYKLYAPAKFSNSGDVSSNVLDVWLLARLEELIEEVTRGYEKYQLDTAVRPLGLFIDDLSTWYVRRSRDRFKEEDAQAALITLRGVLRTVALLMAPVTPFFAEYLYREIREDEDPESVHLCDWPENKRSLIDSAKEMLGIDPHKGLLEDMKEVRKLCSISLEARQKAGIKVRQPLQKVTLKSVLVRGKEDLVSLIRDEINVKEVVFDETLSEDVSLDTNITESLKKEGFVRDLVRAIQDFRKESNLTPSEWMILYIKGGERTNEAVRDFEDEIKRATKIKSIESNTAITAKTISVDGESVDISITKV